MHEEKDPFLILGVDRATVTRDRLFDAYRAARNGYFEQDTKAESGASPSAEEIEIAYIQARECLYEREFDGTHRATVDTEDEKDRAYRQDGKEEEWSYQNMETKSDTPNGKKKKKNCFKKEMDERGDCWCECCGEGACLCLCEGLDGC